MDRRFYYKNYNEEKNQGCFPEVDVQYPEKLHKLHFYHKKIKL